MRLMSLRYKRKGFTLIELLIVISILVILSVAVAMNFIGFDYDARYSSTKSNLASLRSAISLYRSRHSRFPQPTVSGGKEATQNGDPTLEAILTNTSTHGDGTEYIRGNIAGELISSSQETNYVCVVRDVAAFYQDQSSFDNCEGAADGQPSGATPGGGYVYCPVNGAIRLNFTVTDDDLRGSDQSNVGELHPDWSTWANQKPDVQDDWPVRW